MSKKLSYKELLDRYSDFLSQDIPEMDVRRKSFLECGGINYKELINSNLLEFYFNPEEQHGFGNLFLESLLSFIKEDKRLRIQEKFEKIEVVRELTSNSGRIDLTIYGYVEESEKVQSVIIIENKIYHFFENNPFDDYWDSITDVSDKFKVGILLTLHKEDPPTNFINITHRQLINEVFRNIGGRISDIDDRHLLFLKDYKLTIDNLTDIPKMKDSVKFMYENGEKISELVDLENDVFNGLKNQCKSVMKEINLLEFDYKFSSSNAHSFTLSSTSNKFTIKHYVFYQGIFLEKRFGFHSFSMIRNHPEFTDYFDENRHKFDFDLKEIDIEEISDWGSGELMYGEYWPENLTLEDVSDFGLLFKDHFINKVIPFERWIRGNYRNFKSQI
jgi:PD-(D/E)XK nuclease superfamily